MPVVVVHTTESDPGSAYVMAAYLRRMGYEPHEVYDPSNGDWIPLLPASAPGKALVNAPGGVETNNRGGVYQIELIGHAVDVPHYSTEWYANLRYHLQSVCRATDTPYIFPCEFLPYPASYGNTRVRLSFDAWNTISGIVGHQHVPENDHGDPGALNIHLLEDDMPTPAEIWAYPLTIEGTTAPAGEWLGYLYAEVTRNAEQGGKLMRNITAALAADTD